MFLKSILVLALVSTVCSQNYNQDLGISLCQLTVASYCQAQKIQAWNCEPCYNSQIRMENVQTFTNSSGQVVGFIGTSLSPSATYVIFRGALPWDLNKWYSGLDNNKVNYPLCNNGCQVSREFYREYGDFSRNAISTVKEYVSVFQKQKVIVAGHGLGAVFATFAALQLINEGVIVNDLYTFGSPRMGDVRFTSWFDTYIRTNSKNRVTHSHDAVPHMLPGIAGFVHTTHEIFYKGSLRDGWVSCNDIGTREDLACSDKNLNNRTLTDHLNYYDIDFTTEILGCQ